MRLNDQVSEAEITAARERLDAAKEYYEVVKNNAKDLLDKEAAKQELAKAQLDVLNAEIELRNVINKQQEQELQAEQDLIDLSRAKLDLEQAMLASSLRQSGLSKDLADTYAQILTTSQRIENIDREISIAKRAGDERKVLDLQKQRIDLEQEYLDNVESVNEALQGIAENLASSVSPSDDLLASMYALRRASEELGADLSDTLATGFSAWIDSATSMANRLKDIESIMYDSSIVSQNYAARISDIANSAYDVATSMLTFGKATDRTTDAMLKSVDASKRVSDFYQGLAADAEDAAKSIASLLAELDSADIDKIFKDLDLKSIDISGFSNAANAISDAIDSALFFDTDATSEQRRKIVDFFRGLEDDFKDAEGRLRKVLTSDIYDPQVVSKAVDEYRRLGQEIASRTNLSLRDVLDTGLLRSVGDKLNDDAEQFRVKAKRAALQASIVFDEYMSLVEKKAKEMGVSTEKLIDTIKTINTSINPFAGISVSDIDSIASAIRKGIAGVVDVASKIPESVSNLSGIISTRLMDAVGNVASAVESSIESINYLVDNAISAISRLVGELARIRATKINIDVATRVQNQVITPKVDTTFISDAVSQAVTDAIRRAAESMAIEPKVIFNGEITEAPGLTEIADEVMPRVLSAIREELERRQAIGTVNQAGSVC